MNCFLKTLKLLYDFLLLKLEYFLKEYWKYLFGQFPSVELFAFRFMHTVIFYKKFDPKTTFLFLQEFNFVTNVQICQS